MHFSHASELFLYHTMYSCHNLLQISFFLIFLFNYLFVPHTGTRDCNSAIVFNASLSINNWHLSFLHGLESTISLLDGWHA